MKNKGFTLQNFSRKNLRGFTRQNPAFYKEKAGIAGFTLIELLVTISVMVILTGIVLVSYQSGKKQFALQRATNKLAQDIRRAEEKALAAEACCTTPPTVPAGGYGIDLKKKSDGDTGKTYILYADTNNDGRYTPSSVVLETITVEEGVYISSVSPSNASVNFKPPDPLITLKDNTGDDKTALEIFLSLESGAGEKRILINKAGLISISN